MDALAVRLRPERFAVGRLDPSAAVPDPAMRGTLWSVTRTEAELSILCEEGTLPASVPAERGFRCLAVEGPLDFSLVGVVSRLADQLAAAGIPIFLISTYDTDLVFVRDEALPRGIRALRDAGISVNESGS